MSTPIIFRASLEPGGPSFMPTQTIVVPAEVLKQLGGKTAKRVICTVQGHALRLGLLPLEGGGRYLMLNKDVCRAVGIELGQELVVAIETDPNPDHVDLPDELAEALAAWPEAETAFNNYSGSHRRAMARLVDEAKQRETRVRRAVQLVERLGRGLHPFRGD
ncbi:YdeI/OmpD-associated family protein [Hymenobacter sp. BT770]|uniref:YdeI/OmpD-associated family protein n=1 Tax=Hymenobacter sp. BT770 TaxID=2886942 RepID=UPI001D10128B|nr:YdeI/OmpD-associated family protein [Hymenobacter sp. BT770]MCC3153249.1 YdeI/OmpD-associated family protein [Hymenobacter sp. BT770]MDO3414244.1 YdeI/OmpD-associated family protein [Hymenobacter sp. BT770]